MSPEDRDRRTSATRSMDQMLDLLRFAEADGASGLRMDDGYCRSCMAGQGFRYDYDGTIARGGWEFYRLADGLSIAIIDVVAEVMIPRRHRLTDQLVFSAVLDGKLDIIDGGAAEGALEYGFATVYGLLAGQGFDTVYEPGQPLRWISVFIERRRFFALTGLSAEDLPDDVNAFLMGDGRLPYRSVPLSNAAALAVHQILHCELDGNFRRALMTAKAMELACRILHVVVDPGNQVHLLSADDIVRIERALDIIRRHLDTPRSIDQLAEAVGLSRKRLQFGFRARFGDTVGRMQERVRMEKALALVQSSLLPITDIAFETGYEHPASFTRAFKAAFGLSPIALRNGKANMTVKDL